MFACVCNIGKPIQKVGRLLLLGVQRRDPVYACKFVCTCMHMQLGRETFESVTIERSNKLCNEEKSSIMLIKLFCRNWVKECQGKVCVGVGPGDKCWGCFYFIAQLRSMKNWC
eukprot:TRINITY_DN2203_c0_g4_i1.p8 TRINITY_DN2203_c0_g4~~TRINITY_DN2203_c0_g4_i1.p8  ORF type:complete len:113 (+),score=4.68 TRINITY_DN2203_c0_g4_i1:900-1238(+)